LLAATETHVREVLKANRRAGRIISQNEEGTRKLNKRIWSLEKELKRLEEEFDMQAATIAGHRETIELQEQIVEAQAKRISGLCKKVTKYEEEREP